ncbi:hypothetical protein [Marisediminicola sp. LYQ134]|uniref:hypothetical protein n=1 Tax=Marisediminicola sp. LYQ134 TaxID=3391061 RepID=UPI003982FAC3
MTAVTAVASNAGCTAWGASAQECAAPPPSASVTPDGVELGGSVTTPGRPPAPGAQVGPGAGAPGGAVPVVEEPQCDPAVEVCRDGYTVTGPSDEPEEEAQRAITLSDIAGFDASSGTHGMQPNGWSIIGLETNFFVDARTHVRQGSLLGEPASVRFTPVAYRWDYGDGTTVVRTTGGAPWAAGRSNEFTATPTSHAYSRAATHTVSASTDYRAEYRYSDGGPWVSIDGTVTVAAAPLTVRVGTADTVLVDRDCAAGPRGPGC